MDHNKITRSPRAGIPNQLSESENLLTGISASLALNALKMALASREVIAGGVVHLDRGIQYACGDYIARLEAAAGIQPSMSRADYPHDNATAESFIRRSNTKRSKPAPTVISPMPVPPYGVH